MKFIWLPILIKIITLGDNAHQRFTCTRTKNNSISKFSYNYLVNELSTVDQDTETNFHLVHNHYF